MEGSAKFGNRLGTSAVDGGDEIPEHRGGLGAERAHHIDELDDAQAALTALVLGNKRLVFAKTVGDLGLCQALALAQSRAAPCGARSGAASAGCRAWREVKVEDSGLTA